MPKTKYDINSNLIAYENGELSEQDIVVLFQHLIRTGQVWQMHPSYGRVAAVLIENGDCLPIHHSGGGR